LLFFSLVLPLGGSKAVFLDFTGVVRDAVEQPLCVDFDLASEKRRRSSLEFCFFQKQNLRRRFSRKSKRQDLIPNLLIR